MKRSPMISSEIAFFVFVISVIFFVICAFVIPRTGKKKEFLSIEKLMKEGKLDVSISGLGGHQEECVTFNIKNLTGDTVLIRIEPGRILHSIDTTLQDIFIVKHQDITLLPFASLEEKGYGFCCKSHHHSPGKESVFTIGAMASESWQKLANVIDQNRFPVKAIQDAVWCLSNDHPISAITDKNPAHVDLLRRTVAEIKGIEVPWYTVLFEEVGTENELFSDKYLQVTGKINYSVKGNGIISMVVKDQKGNALQTLVRGEPKGSGNYIYDLNLSVANWPKGEYSIYIYEDYSNLNKKVLFKL